MGDVGEFPMPAITAPWDRGRSQCCECGSKAVRTGNGRTAKGTNQSGWPINAWPSRHIGQRAHIDARSSSPRMTHDLRRAPTGRRTWFL